MAVLPMNLYRDFSLSQVAMQLVPGVAAAFGVASDLANWTPATGGSDTLYYITGDRAGENNLILSGGATIWNAAISQGLPYDTDAETDNTSEDQSYPKIYNPFFSGATIIENVRYTITLSIYCVADGNTPVFYTPIYFYTQEPAEASGSSRTTYHYYRAEEWGYGSSGLRTQLDGGSKYTLIKCYKITIQEKQYVMLAIGVAADNTYDTTQSSLYTSSFILIPLEWFKDKEVKPWAGDESEDNAAESYFPTTPYRDSILVRDLTGKRNPYGFNQGNGMKLAVIGYESYAKILEGIYCGTAEGLLNKLAQAYYQITGGNDHRQAEEIQTIISAILCCHLLPKITGILSGTMRMKTIAGYHIFGQNTDGAQFLTVAKTDYTIFAYDSQPKMIEPRLNSFLDYEPYTSISLHLPFMSSVNIPPSALYGNYLTVHYEIDIYTGILSADVIITEPIKAGQTAREYIISTQQANVRTEIPVMGNGATGAPLAQIASSVLGVARSSAPEFAAAGGIISGVDELSKASTGIAVGRNTVEGIGTYLSSREAYLIITRPEPANPSNFLEMEGSTANLPGVVGDFTGFSIFDDVKLEGFSATDDEKKAIEALLKGGVYV